MERKKKREGGNNILLAVSVLRVLMYVLSWCVVLLWLCDILIWFLSRSRFRLFGGDGDGGSRFSSCTYINVYSDVVPCAVDVMMW